MRRRNVVLGLSSIIGAIGVVLSVSAATKGAVSSKSQTPAARADGRKAPIQARLAAVAHGPVSHPIHAAGQIRAKSQVDLAFLVGGEVSWVGVEVGSKVRRGQLLAKLDETQVAADADRAQAAASQSQRDLERARRLEESGAVAATMLESAQTGQAIASAQARVASFALRHSVLVAPEDGIIDMRLVERGQTVAPGQPAFRLSGKSRGAVIRANLGDRDVVGLGIGRRATVYMDALGDTPFAAKVSQIAPAASPGSGTFEVEIRLDHAPADYKNGMTGKIDIERKVEVGAVVPVDALVPGDEEGASVIAVEDGRARRWPVHVLFFEGEQAALKEPLSGVQQVATQGAGMLGNGDPVAVVQP
jgi:membrane fusion protein, multidrug efflux system